MTSAAIAQNDPWYRQFWPWFLIAIPACTVAGCMYTIFLAVTTSDSLVVRAEDGIDMETSRNLAAEALAAELGLSATLTVDRDTGAIRAVVDQLPAEFAGETLTLSFQHPAFAGRDQFIPLAPTPEKATFVGHTTRVPDGRWYIVIEQADRWRLTSTYRGSEQTVLEPRGAR